MTTRYKYNTATTEQYTPADVIDKVRRVFGGVIDLDPCSSELANLTVGASKFFCAAEDGLKQFWVGANIFVNPPYSRGVIERWAKKSVYAHVEYGKNVIWLSNNGTETTATQCIMSAARLVHFPNKRMKFYCPLRPKQKATALQGQIIALLTYNETFAHRFRAYFKEGVTLDG